MLPGLAGVAGFLSGAAVTVSYGGTASDAPPFSQSMAIGTAASNRRVVVCVAYTDTSATLGSCTVGGQACTLLQAIYIGGFVNIGIYITDDPVTSGTTATVAWDTADSSGVSGVAQTYAVYASRATAFDSETSFASDPSVSIDVPEKGAVIAVSAVRAASDTCSWSNATEGGQVTGGNIEASAASYTTDVPVTGRTIQATWTVGSADGLVAVSLSPE